MFEAYQRFQRQLERQPVEFLALHRIEVPVFETPHGWVLRVSVQGYNDESDLRALADALASVR